MVAGIAVGQKGGNSTKMGVKTLTGPLGTLVAADFANGLLSANLNTDLCIWLTQDS